MVNRYALVCDGAVTNVVLWDGESEWAIPDGCELVALTDDQLVNPGDTYDGQSFTANPTTVPVASVPVEVNPAVINDLLVKAQAATTVAATRSVISSLLQQLAPDG